MTDPETADQTYIGPMTPELVEQIIAKVTSRMPARPPRCLDTASELCRRAAEQAGV